MKLNQKLLKEMVREVLLEAQDEAGQVTAMESGLIDQIEEFITNLASKEGVDLVNDRTVIQKIMQMLSNRILGQGADDVEALKVKSMSTSARKKSQVGRLKGAPPPPPTTGEPQ